MLSVPRRILIYWLLLLLPTCAVGLGAIQLLRREQARLAEQAGQAAEARRAALTARAGLIVENVELLVGDIQTGLLDALAGLPGDDLPRELSEWSRANPMVRAAFHARADGTLLHVAAEREEAAGFRRRAAAAWSPVPPWRTAGEAEPLKKLEAFSADAAATATREEQTVRARASQNVAKLQSARRDAQSLSRARRVAAADDAAQTADELVRAPHGQRAAEVARGWSSWSREGRPHVFGWVERADGVLGLELELSTLVARLAAALPDETSAGDGFALVDERGRVMQQAGFVPRAGGPGAVSLPVAASALEDWTVIGYLAAPGSESSAGPGFLLLGSVLVAILVIAILAGGSLLFWQARRSEAEAVQKTSFVANVSHEFKTPLTTIRLYAELLENGRVADAQRRNEYLRTISRETQRLARLVGNALDFSRLEQGRKKFARTPLDLRAEVSRLADAHALRLQESGVALRIELPPEPLELMTDRDALEQIVLNLLDNAAKYGASGGEVTLQLGRRADGGARLGVLDRGPGVPVAHRERVFEKFHRVDETLTAEQGGAGLGLSIARQLARGLGGELRYEPREGGGAHFILELP